MSSLAFFVVFKVGMALGLIAFALREIRIARQPDRNPEYTRKLVHVFSASQRARRRPAPDPITPALEPDEPEPVRRAA